MEKIALEYEQEILNDKTLKLTMIVWIGIWLSSHYKQIK